ncbi:MAG: aldose 1-epimerase [Planctomycetaceae bacterium]
MHGSPEIVPLAAGAARATIVVGRGGACASAVLESPQGPRDVLWAPADFTGPTGRPSGGGIPILCPFPGRLPTTTIDFGGRVWSLPPGDALGRPIHGLVHDRPWRVVERDAARLVIAFRLSADAPDALHRWPADFSLTATWSLGPGRLEVALDLLAHGTMPAALGLHPYHPVPVVPGADPRDAAIEVPAALWQPQERLLPVGVPRPAEERRRDDGSPIGLPGAAAWEGLVLDDPFCGLAPDALGRVVARVVDRAGGAAIRAEWDPVFSACVIFTPPHRQAVCIEPCSTLPGRGDFAAAAGWRVLADGERLTARYAVAAV